MLFSTNNYLLINFNPIGKQLNLIFYWLLQFGMRPHFVNRVQPIVATVAQHVIQEATVENRCKNVTYLRENPIRNESMAKENLIEPRVSK